MKTTIHYFGTLLTLLAGVMLLALSSAPADAATTFIINKTGDGGDSRINGRCDASPATGGQCTLRAAIQEANATPGADTINFAIGGTATVKTISPTLPLPAVTESVTIDGYSQGSTTETTSDDAKPNEHMFLENGSNATIKIQIKGTNAGANANGLKITAPESTIKGLAINRFARSGILVASSLATGNEVEGNFVGTNASGTLALPNAGDGVRINGAPENTIGGTEPAQYNLLSGNDGDGVRIGGSGATQNRVEGNFIGTTADVTQALGNADDGVYISAANNTIGGDPADVAGNTIAGNGNNGVEISGDAATGNKVEGNFIGTTAYPGRPNLGNTGDGVLLIGGAYDNTIGSTQASGVVSGNRIAFNGGDGVLVSSSDSSTGNRILGNEIFENGGLGIDLAGGNEDSFGVTANDTDLGGSTDDSDTGPNDLQNFPLIWSATELPGGGAVEVRGVLNSTPNQTFTIQFFTGSYYEPSGHGEGEHLMVPPYTVTTDANGEAMFYELMYAAGSQVTATATNTATGNTSEFSMAVPVSPSPF